MGRIFSKCKTQMLFWVYNAKDINCFCGKEKELAQELDWVAGSFLDRDGDRIEMWLWGLGRGVTSPKPNARFSLRSVILSR